MVLPAFVAIEQALQDAGGRVSYQAFGAAFRAPPPPPSFIFGTLPGFLAPDLFGETEIGGVGCYRLHDAQVIFDGIILQRGTALWSLALNHPLGHVRAVLSAQAAGWASLPVRRIAGQVAVIHGPGFDIFGHWLIDFLPRLYGLHRAGVDIADIKFVLPVQTPGFARSLLERIGIPAENLIWHDQKAERLEPDALIVPSLFRLRSRFHPLMVAATRFWLDRVAGGGAPGPTGRRLFVSRKRVASARMLRNRADIEARAMGEGYEIVAPETMTLPEQITLFGAARHILGEYGSGLHGSLFAPPGTTVCALRGTSHHPGFAQSGLAERFGHTVGYVFGATPEHAGDHEFSIDTGAFDAALSAMQAWSVIAS
jgi:capsular polysaccharide biosynthesis protein